MHFHSKLLANQYPRVGAWVQTWKMCLQIRLLILFYISSRKSFTPKLQVSFQPCGLCGPQQHRSLGWFFFQTLRKFLLCFVIHSKQFFSWADEEKRNRSRIQNRKLIHTICFLSKGNSVFSHFSLTWWHKKRLITSNAAFSTSPFTKIGDFLNGVWAFPAIWYASAAYRPADK